MFQRHCLRLKDLIISVIAFAVCLAVFLVLVIYTGRPREEVDLGLEYYFLVRDCEESTSAAVVQEVYSYGGAGYLDGENVILACYYLKSDARRVCSLMEQRGESVYVQSRALKSITLRGESVKFRDEISANAQTAESVARLLYETANGLETGSLSQALAKNNLKGAADALNGLISLNVDPFFEKWNRELYSSASAIRTGAGTLLFSKDVRYLQVELCLSLLSMDSCF